MAGLLGSVWHPLPRRAAESIAFVACSGVAVILAFFLFAYRFAQPPELFARLSRFVHLEQPLRYLHEVTHYYVGNMKLIGVILGISFLTQGAGLASFVLFGAALKVDIPLTAYLMLVPLGLMLTAIPVTPAGLGVGQVAFLSLFHLAGTSQGANLYTLYMASFVLINLSGAFLYVGLRFPGSLPQTVTPAEGERE